MSSTGCSSYDNKLSLYRDSRLSSDEKADVDQHLLTCDACQSAIQQAEALASVWDMFPKADFEAPRTDRIMQAIDTLEAEGTEETEDAVSSFWEALLAPMRYVVPAAVTCAVLFLALGSYSTPKTSTTPSASTNIESVLIGDSNTKKSDTTLEELLVN